MIPFHPFVTPPSNVNSGILTDNLIGVSSPIDVPIPPKFSKEVMIWMPDISISKASSWLLTFSAEPCNSLVSSVPICSTIASNPSVVNSKL